MAEIQIQAGPEDLKGRYSNFMQVSHSKEEFVMDFLNVSPPSGTLVSRVITSPGHFKRIIAALQDNIAKYESQFGKIEEAKSLAEGEIGFKTN
jgi:hypothetical protein